MPEKQYFTGIDIINAPRIEHLTVTEDGTYTASSDVIGYNPVVVNTNQPWQPLEDGYSNFWFELTNDTLNPWLNFSAKTENAIIDWGDGSGEVALDTLTPTHTYSKAGKYVVKVKGVTGIGAQVTLPIPDDKIEYTKVLRHIELNEEISILNNTSFRYSLCLENAFICAGTIRTEAFVHCPNLKTLMLPDDIEELPQSLCNSVYMIETIDIPNTVTSIGSTAFYNCPIMHTIHCRPSTPPTLGNSAFNNIRTNFIIYVPVGTGDTYKAAAGWSTYADHILEEGQTPNRAMLAKFNSGNTDNEEMR